MGNVINQNKHQHFVKKSNKLLFVINVIQLVMLALISYQQHAPHVCLATTYGKERVNLNVLNLPTSMNKVSNV